MQWKSKYTLSCLTSFYSLILLSIYSIYCLVLVFLYYEYWIDYIPQLYKRIKKNTHTWMNIRHCLTLKKKGSTFYFTEKLVIHVHCGKINVCSHITHCILNYPDENIFPENKIRHFYYMKLPLFYKCHLKKIFDCLEN